MFIYFIIYILPGPNFMRLLNSMQIVRWVFRMIKMVFQQIYQLMNCIMESHRKIYVLILKNSENAIGFMVQPCFIYVSVLLPRSLI